MSFWTTFERRVVQPRVVILVIFGIGVACLWINIDLPIVRNSLVYARAAEHVIQHGYNPIPVVADSRLSYDKPIAFAWLAAPLVSLWGTIVGLKSASFVFTCAFVLAVWLFVRTYDPLRLCNRERSLALWLVCCNPLVVYQFWSAYPDTLFAALTLVAFSLTHIIATRTNQNTRKWIPVLALTVVAAILVRNYGLILLILV